MIGQAGSPKRILFFNTEAELYGGERCLLEVVQRLGPGWAPRFVLPGPGRFERTLRESGYEIDEFAIPRGLLRSELRRLPTVLRLARLIRRRHADLVHLNLHFAWPIVSPACLLAGVPLVIHVRNMLSGQPGRLDRRLFQRAAAVICISQAVRQRVLDLGLVRLGRPPRVELIPDGRVLARYQHGDGERVRRELGIPRESPLVGMVARLEPMKGQDLFLRMAAAVAQRVPAARFLVVGDTMNRQQEDYLRELEDLARQPPLAGRVSFLGFRDDVPDVLAALDCFVHPSRRGAFVSVLIEAMATGVPIVASDVDGIPECVGREGAAELVGTLDPGSFADATCRVLADADHAARMRAAGRERARRLFDIAPLARRTEDVLAECVRGK
ncbi:MAG: glycosyltransferase family 4 protein [Deltaproteobacteria bacterium]